MAVNETRLLEENKRDILAVDQLVSAGLVLIPLFNTTATIINASVTLFALDALGGTMKDIKFGFYLDADAAATFTVSVWKTRAGDLVTFVRDLSKASAALPWTIVTPPAGWYTFEVGDLEEGLQMEIRIAQSNAGDATNLCDAVLTYLR